MERWWGSPVGEPHDLGCSEEAIPSGAVAVVLVVLLVAPSAELVEEP